MSTVVIRRPPRRPAPELPSGELIVDAPPELPVPAARGMAQMLMMVPMFAGSAAMALMFTSYGGAGAVRWVVGGLFGVSAVGMVVAGAMGGVGGGAREMAGARRHYLRHLSQHRARITRTVRRQRAALAYLHPEPDQLWALAGSFRLWERRRGDADFAVARIGTGPQPVATPIVAPHTKPLEDLEPLSAAALRRFVTGHATVPDLPVALALGGFGRVYVRGDATGTDDLARDLVRAVVCQLATFHAPDDLRIAVIAGPDTRVGWEWLKWLPHAQHPDRTDALGPLRLVTASAPSLEAIVDDLLSQRSRFDPDTASVAGGPQLVVVLDGGDIAGSDHLMTDGGVDGVTIVDLSTPPPRLLDRGALQLDIDADGGLAAATTDGRGDLGLADRLDVAAAEALARQLAPKRLSAAARDENQMHTAFGLAELLDLGDPHDFDPRTTWLPRPNRDRLRVRLGLQADGAPIELDLKESAQDGMGPHGLLIGATGSGKSELLRTLVLALAVTHPSQSLNFVLVDFKGGATFTKLDRLPHTSAVITNLAEELTLVDRMADAINGELLRRQELLRRAGNFASLRDYEKARAAGAPLPEVPTLLVICDEFSELLSAKPDFIDMFVQIGRVGRSLGVHLLLASQKLDEGRLRGLDTHLSYRIGLRTFSAMESRVVLGVADAYELPRAPGHGYLKIGTETMQRFRSAYVSGVYRRTETAAATGDDSAALIEYTTHYVAPAITAAEPEAVDEADDDAVGETLLDILVERLEHRGVPAHQVWLPPLREAPPLDELLPTLVDDPSRGCTVADPSWHGTLAPVVGLVDRPLEQRHDPLRLDLSGSAGHVAVVGGPQSGKSTALRTMLLSLALTHTPREVQFFCLDFGGGALSALRDLPHVGGVATRLQEGAVRRTIAEVGQLLVARERAFAEHGCDGMADYRASAACAGDPYGDAFLVVDGWLALRTEFDELEPVVADIANRGLAYGIHLVTTCARWFDLRGSVRDLFGTRLELRLGDPADSGVDRRAALNVPTGMPGRGLDDTGHQMIVARPRTSAGPTDLAGGVAALVARIRTGWPIAGAPPVRLLPQQIGLDDVLHLERRQAANTGVRPAGVPFGLAELDLGPAYLDLSADPHLMIFGDAQCGKTNLLRVLARRLAATHTPQQARLIAVDYRRGLLGAIEGEHLVGYFTDSTGTAAMARDIAGVLAQRRPGPDVTPEQLRERSWWTGPDIYLFVDDYDLVAGQLDNPLLPLLEHVAQGRDVGLHVIVSRRSGGAGRALFEQFLLRLRELGSPGLIMSGDKDEGPLVGTVKPQVLPPGRGWLVDRRGGAQLVQTAWSPSGA